MSARTLERAARRPAFAQVGPLVGPDAQLNLNLNAQVGPGDGGGAPWMSPEEHAAYQYHSGDWDAM